MNIDDATTVESAAGDAGVFRFSLAHSMVRQPAWVVAVVAVAVLIVAVVVPVVLIAVGVGLALWGWSSVADWHGIWTLSRRTHAPWPEPLTRVVDVYYRRKRDQRRA
ncbi:hypothetical protein JGU71_22305 [Antrihabitans sp. YC3-6]|uniref:Uncharacterized protein n=1 Tax=Antrihabitans stalagmiti TaxID=2799499 RepID=A0A934NUP1_9NOCA|nr:hypothetical protein [Antrihabitans stalagmiti]MBJ8341622.1 hypothetical protein [Antrihabitans stalagmiti]